MADISPAVAPAAHPDAQAGVAPMRVVVIDADARTRDSLAGLLEVRDRFQVVGRAGQAAEAARLVDELKPDVVLVDPRLPELDGGAALIRVIRARNRNVVILAVGWTPQLEHDLVAAGADAFVRKTFRPSELADAIGRCLAACSPDRRDPAPA
jgi:two-component system, NarL family, nitrate/nitrite response regulator NarL